MHSLEEANRMLDTFASVGANRFDVTFFDIDGQKRGFRKDQSIGQLKNSLPFLTPGLRERQNNPIVRPRASNLFQLDDLDGVKLKQLADVAFLVLETSPGNHQAWVAVDHKSEVSKMAHADLARRLRNVAGADPTASGATRVAGLPNYKRKYEPDFPTVKVARAQPGRITTNDELESLGLVAAPQLWTEKITHRNTGAAWPDYQRCLAGAPLNHAGNAPDKSRADFFFALLAAQQGHTVQEIASRLMEESSKARENGTRYAELTARNASAAGRTPQSRG